MLGGARFGQCWQVRGLGVQKQKENVVVVWVDTLYSSAWALEARHSERAPPTNFGHVALYP